MSQAQLHHILRNLREQRHELARQAIARTWGTAPGYQPERLRVRELRASLGQTIADVIDILQDPQAAMSDALGRASDIGSTRALQGVPIQGLVLSYLNLERVLTDALMEFSGNEHELVYPKNVRRMSDILDELRRACMDTYEHTRNQIAPQHDRLSGDLISGLVRGNLTDAQIEEIAGTLNCKATWPYQAIALSTSPSPQPSFPAVRALISLLAPVMPGRALLGSVSQAEVVLVPGEINAELREAISKEVLERSTSGIRAAIGAVAPTLRGGGRSARQAVKALAYAADHQLSQLVTYDDLLIELLALGDAEVIPRIIERYIDPLNDRPELLQTVVEFFGANGSMKKTAHGLGIHPNTVSYRLDRVAEIANLDPRDNSNMACFVVGYYAAAP